MTGNSQEGRVSKHEHGSFGKEGRKQMFGRLSQSADQTAVYTIIIRASNEPIT